MPSRRKVPLKKKPKVPAKQKVKSEVGKFVSTYPKTIVGIKKMSVDLYKFLTPANTRHEYTHAYNNYSVERLLKEKRVPVLYAPGASGKMRPKWGCYTLCRVMFASLKKMGLKPKMARYFLEGKGPLLAQRKITLSKNHRPHTSIFFEFEGKIYNVDPFFPMLPVHEVTKKELSDLTAMNAQNKFFFVKPGQIPFEEFTEELLTGAIHPKEKNKRGKRLTV